MYGDDAISRDMNSLLYSSTFKHPSDGEFAKIKELIALDPYAHHHKKKKKKMPEIESSLMRYRSVPTSFANLLNGCDEDFLDPQEEEEEEEEEEDSFFTRLQQKSESDSPEEGEAVQKQHLPPPAPVAGGSRASPSLLPASNYKSNGLETCSSLTRQTSSPAGFLSSSTTTNGFAALRDSGKSGSSNRLNNHISFSSTSHSSSRFLPQIAENGNEMDVSTINGLKRSRDKMFLDTQNGGDSGAYAPSLVHHMSLPKTSSEMATVEKFLQFQQESVPCKIRAKRGFATHPRSIAERVQKLHCINFLVCYLVRRTRISERMKKLQELFPNMDKQINTAEMLDMVVEYIKDLQKEVQALNDIRARCMCSSKQLHSASTK